MDVFEITLNSITNNLHELKVISSNVANVNTAGYLKGQTFAERINGEANIQEQIDFSKSTIKDTNRTLDVAIKGKGFFQVAQAGNMLITRDGHFHINKDSLLSHSSGAIVYGVNGPLHVVANETSIRRNGDIYVSGQFLDKLLIVDVKDPTKLLRQGNNLFISQQGYSSTGDVGLKTQALNGSNVESSAEMVRMIEVSRQLQTSQKVVNAYDQLLNVGINELGKR